MVTIAKDFHWEMGHRLMNHKGLCQNPHGHSYKLRLILRGNINPNTNMLIDYYDMDRIVSDMIAIYDHSFVIEDNDIIMKTFLTVNNFKWIALPTAPTAENLCNAISSKLLPKFQIYNNIVEMIVRIYETNDVYSEINYKL